MLGRNQAFETFVTQLESLSQSFPVRATAFHAYVKDVLERAREAEHTSFRPKRAQEMARVLRESDAVNQLAVKLSELLAAVEEAIAEADIWAKQAEGAHDPLLKNCALMHLEDCRRRIKQVGSDVRSVHGIAGAFDQLASLRLELVRERRALHLLQEAETLELHLTARNELAAAALSVDLEEWRKEFSTPVLIGTSTTLRQISPSPGSDWIAKVEKSLDEHRGKLEPERSRISARPQTTATGTHDTSQRISEKDFNKELRSSPIATEKPREQVMNPTADMATYSGPEINKLLADCREWSQLLRGDIAEVRPLMTRRQQLDQNHAPSAAFDELGNEAAALRHSLRGKVMIKLAELRGDLGARVQLLYSVCPSAPSLLEALLEPLDATPEAAVEFQDALDKVRRDFGAVAQNFRSELNQERTRRLLALEQAILEAQRMRRTQAISSELTEALRALPKATEVPADGTVILADLAKFAALAAQLREWATEVAQNVSAFLTRRAELSQLIDNWAAPYSRLVSPTTASPAAYRAELDTQLDWPSDAIIDSYVDWLSGRWNQFERDREVWRSAAHEQIRTTSARLAAKFDQIQDIPGIEVGAVSFSDPPQEAAELAAMMDLLVDHAGRIEAKLTEAADRIRVQLPKLKQRIEEFLVDPNFTHHPGRVVAEEIVAEYPDADPPAGPDTFETIWPLRDWWRQCDTFFYDLDHELASLRNEIRVVRERAEALTRENWHRFRPAMFDRAWKLILGAEAETENPETGRVHLREARVLIDALTRDAQRRVIGELVETRAVLESMMRGSGDAQFVSRARRLLSDAQFNGSSRLPSAAIRRELQILAKRGNRP